MCVCVCVCLCIYPSHSPWGACNTRSIFKWSKAGFEFEFSFSLTGFLTKAKEPLCPTIYPLLVEEQIDSCLSQGH